MKFKLFTLDYVAMSMGRKVLTQILLFIVIGLLLICSNLGYIPLMLYKEPWALIYPLLSYALAIGAVVYLLFYFLPSMDTMPEKEYGFRFQASRTLIGFAVIIAANLLVMLITGVDSTENQSIIETQFKTFGPGFAILVIFGAPILEELIFRKYLMSYLFRGHQVGIFCSALFFAIIHQVANIEQLLTYLAPGLVLGYLFYKYQSLSINISLHILVNLIASILFFTTKF
ncbi:hypothetical protein CJP74_02135 [Psittacicella melopsittaci]|uniref:CAAX prenyl protease 2/Lysostaphin resistance protein A-like domain-containing protein n=2 Tax=Psittacicella melopsittaci TaxID=2028576 RepID=A0A3A1Y7G0_9GAMM|nr:hypothetical protein CJP74_02135 [Psittacicella melopsittaci]